MEMGILKDFREFAMRGNVVDMAVGVVIGGAFGKIVSSLVNDIVMPPIGVLLNGAAFKELAVTLKDPVIENGETVVEAVTLKYGMFIQNVVDFLIIALVVFLAVRFMTKLKKKPEVAPAAPPEPSAEEKLLTEIRDLLKSQQK